MRYFSDSSVAVFPSFIIENNIVLDCASTKAPKLFGLYHIFSIVKMTFFSSIFFGLGRPNYLNQM